MEVKVVTRPPRAAMLIESMRDVGYSLDTALADVIDNAIAAGARKVSIYADTAAGRLAIVDDGRGMSEGELLEAMRPGSQSPLAVRDESDLGRFGLGLKTASFSQCRSLTVATRKNGALSTAVWDLDFVAERDEWALQIPRSGSDLPWIDRVASNGTLVLWDKLDRCLSSETGGVQDFTRRLSEAVDHLELVFHRYLASERGVPSVQIDINGRALEPCDPFAQNHRATIVSPIDVIQYRGNRIKIQAFTLPHRSKVSAAEWEKHGGRGGHLKNQGFYLYRAKRLIVHGTWFGLARQMELTKLARVRIDISNDMDSDWKLDVKKASAQPPLAIRERLRRIIETLGSPSRKVFTRRGAQLTESNRLPIWTRTKDKGEIRYELSPQHPLIVDLETHLDGVGRDKLRRLLILAAASLPYDALLADMGADIERVRSRILTEELLEEPARVTYGNLRNSGFDKDTVLEMMQSAEPFRSNWGSIAKLFKKLE